MRWTYIAHKPSKWWFIIGKEKKKIVKLKRKASQEFQVILTSVNMIFYYKIITEIVVVSLNDSTNMH